MARASPRRARRLPVDGVSTVAGWRAPSPTVAGAVQDWRGPEAGAHLFPVSSARLGNRADTLQPIARTIIQTGMHRAMLLAFVLREKRYLKKRLYQAGIMLLRPLFPLAVKPSPLNRVDTVVRL